MNVRVHVRVRARACICTCVHVRVYVRAQLTVQITSSRCSQNVSRAESGSQLFPCIASARAQRLWHDDCGKQAIEHGQERATSKIARAVSKLGWLTVSGNISLVFRRKSRINCCLASSVGPWAAAWVGQRGSSCVAVAPAVRASGSFHYGWPAQAYPKALPGHASGGSTPSLHCTILAAVHAGHGSKPDGQLVAACKRQALNARVRACPSESHLMQ